ncbi:MAG: HAD hydrolase-like protein [Burkholderiales bacterium]|nr:HAD hydrolase-like protein [Anaerolineae bacterium]
MTQQTNRIQLILFDVDGTLLWTRGLGRAAMREAMLEVFGNHGVIDGHEFGGKTDWQTLVELLGENGYDETRIGEHMPHFETSIQRHIGQFVEAGTFDVTACPGAVETVEALRQRDDVLVGVLTGNVSTTTPVKLRAAGFDPAAFVIGAYGSEKLDRNHLPTLALERASAHLGRTITPQQVMIVGDTLADIACARAIGAVVTIVATGFSPREALIAAQPDYFLEDLTSFMETFDGILGE